MLHTTVSTNLIGNADPILYQAVICAAPWTAAKRCQAGWMAVVHTDNASHIHARAAIICITSAARKIRLNPAEITTIGAAMRLIAGKPASAKMADVWSMHAQMVIMSKTICA